MLKWKKKTYKDEQYELPFGDIPYCPVCRLPNDCGTYTMVEREKCRQAQEQQDCDPLGR